MASIRPIQKLPTGMDIHLRCRLPILLRLAWRQGGNGLYQFKLAVTSIIPIRIGCHIQFIDSKSKLPAWVEAKMSRTCSRSGGHSRVCHEFTFTGIHFINQHLIQSEITHCDKPIRRINIDRVPMRSFLSRVYAFALMLHKG